MNNKAIINDDVSMNKNLDLSGSLIAHNNVNVYGIINQYTVSLNTQTQYVTINSSGINTSLSNLINVQRTTYLSQILSNLNLSEGDLTNLTTSNVQISAVLQGMYNFYQKINIIVVVYLLITNNLN